MPVILDSSEIKVIDGDKNFTIETVKSNVIVNQDTEINEPVVPILQLETTVSSETIDETYKYMAFTHSGGSEDQTEYSLNFNIETECDILIVGGGGAGGNSLGGGGGAGGTVYTINQTLSAETYTIGVGKGGIGIGGSSTINDVQQIGRESYIKNSDGSYVQLNMGGTNQNLKGFGGGTGGCYYTDGSHTLSDAEGQDGGSGGGASDIYNNSQSTSLPGGTATQPNTFWNGTSYISGGSDGNQNITNPSGSFYECGGGGAIGGLNNNTTNGKNGVQIDITGTSKYYAGGGGGGIFSVNTNYSTTTYGLGGSGGGGNGSYHNGTTNLRLATSGVNGTGSGGGGKDLDATANVLSGAGGSGIVIIRYKVVDVMEPQTLTHYTPERMYPPTRDLASASHLISGESYGNGVYEVSESDGTYDPSKTGFSAFNTSMSDRVHFNNKYTNGVYNGSDYIVPGYLGDWIKIKLPRPIKLTRYGFKQRTTLQRAPGKYKLYGSNDGTNWDVLVHKRTTVSYTQQISVANDYFEENINVNNQYQYFGLVANQLNSNTQQILNFDEWYIYGKEFISEEPEYKTLTFEHEAVEDLLIDFEPYNDLASWINYAESKGFTHFGPLTGAWNPGSSTNFAVYGNTPGGYTGYIQLELPPNYNFVEVSMRNIIVGSAYQDENKLYIDYLSNLDTSTAKLSISKGQSVIQGFSYIPGQYLRITEENVSVLDGNLKLTFKKTQTEYTVNFPEDTECDILIVGGGGSGGCASGTSVGAGGGGGGEVKLIQSFQASANTSYNILVGKGGNGVLNQNWQDNPGGKIGNNTSFDTYTAIGGGGGGARNISASSSSTYTGGGEGGLSGGGNTGAIGYDGGNEGGTTTLYGAGGGGGAGGVGQDGSGDNGGDGGVGLDRVGDFIFSEKFGTSYGHLEGGTIWFGGGGGGSGEKTNYTNGIGRHGGTDANNTNGISQNALWGGGSGGAIGTADTDIDGDGSYDYRSGAGGSGIVIIRYKTQYQATTHGAQWTYHSTNPNTHHYGNVGIGTTASATQKLLVNGDMNVTGNYKQNDNTIGNWYTNGTDVYRTSGNVGIGNTAPQYSLHVHGGVYAGQGGTTGNGTTVWTSTSDSRMKDNIFKASYKECYDIFKKIELYRYNFKPGHVNSNDRNQLGFIAQEVQQQIPNSVEPRSIRLSSGVYIHDILTLNVTQINYILYGTFKYLIAELDIIKKHLESQEEAGQTE